MLSKVLNRRDSGKAQTMIFASLSPGAVALAGGGSRGASEEAGDQGGAERAILREKLGQLEAEAAEERREAFESGRQQGDRQARAELLPVIERLNASIAQILEMRPELRRRAERDVVQLSLLIAKRVLHRQLNVDEGALTALARVTFERLTRAESYTVTVNPRFAAAVT